MGEKVSFAAYARHRGVSAVAVTVAVGCGRITSEVDPATGKDVLDIERADAEWDANTDHQKRINAEGPGESSKRTIAAAAGLPSLTESRARRESIKAKIDQLDLDEKEGRLVEKEAVKRDAYKTARVIRDAFILLPDRVSAEFASETEQFKIHERLSAEIRQIMEGLKFDEGE